MEGGSGNADVTEPTAPSGPIIRRARPAERGLLLIYLLEAPLKESSRCSMAASSPNIRIPSWDLQSVSPPA